MAGQLSMIGLSLNDSKHANGPTLGRPAYVPPHMRGHAGPPPMMDGPAPGEAAGASAWGNNAYVHLTSDHPRPEEAFIQMY